MDKDDEHTHPPTETLGVLSHIGIGAASGAERPGARRADVNEEGLRP